MKKMSLEEFARNIKWPDEEECARRAKIDLERIRRKDSNPYEPVPDTTSHRSLISQDTTNTLGEHNPELWRQIYQGVGLF